MRNLILAVTFLLSSLPFMVKANNIERDKSLTEMSTYASEYAKDQVKDLLTVYPDASAKVTEVSLLKGSLVGISLVEFFDKGNLVVTSCLVFRCNKGSCTPVMATPVTNPEYKK